MTHPYVPHRDAGTGEEYIPVSLTGHDLLEDPLYNKGTAWPPQERQALGLVGLLPPHVSTEAEQLERAYENFSRKESDLERFVFLQGLMDRNEVLFYRLLIEHLEEMLPIVYTPTVGEACREFHHIFRRPRGLYVDAENAHRSAELLVNAMAHGPISVAVVTDGERILGLGDLGANGMGIPIGKLALYVAAGGFHPATTLPVLLDVGTDNEALREDPLYLGTKRPRLRGEEYHEVVRRFVAGFEEACPGALLQFEDFKKGTAIRLLDDFRDEVLSFNDDIQGTGAVTLAAILAGLRLLDRPLCEQRVLLVGSGAAGVGIAHALQAALAEEGSGEAEIFLADSKGLVVRGRPGLEGFKEELAADPERMRSLGLPDPEAPLDRVASALQPTVLVGTSGQPGLFDEPVVRAVAAGTDRPIVLPLSNPTASSEATPQQITEWSEGRALVATGSPFPPVRWEGETRPVGQCNNVFVFPGVALGARISGAARVPDELFTAGARALAGMVTEDELASGRLLPTISRIREVSAAVAAAAARAAVACGTASAPSDIDWEERARAAMWVPRYLPLRFEG